jgi:ankyrin repeat protein
MAAADCGDDERLAEFVAQGFPLDVTEPGTGATALHIAAAGGARRAVMTLIESGRVDFLIRDREGRLASEMAGVYGDDPAMARLLRIKERKQADAQGIRLTRRPRPGA